jgi:hypothetical protein
MQNSDLHLNLRQSFHPLQLLLQFQATLALQKQQLQLSSERLGCAAAMMCTWTSASGSDGRFAGILPLMRLKVNNAVQSKECAQIRFYEANLSPDVGIEERAHLVRLSFPSIIGISSREQGSMHQAMQICVVARRRR